MLKILRNIFVVLQKHVNFCHFRCSSNVYYVIIEGLDGGGGGGGSGIHYSLKNLAHYSSH